MMYQDIRAFGLPVKQGLLQRIEHKVRAHRTADTPAHYAPRQSS
jgi:hypothetical protein